MQTHIFLEKKSDNAQKVIYLALSRDFATDRSLQSREMVMISFSEKCIAALDKELASRHLAPIEFDLVRGKHESYLYAKVVQKDLLIELYVYTDEAGCKLNKRDWKIFEKWDFSDDNELIQRFVAYVISVLTTGPGIKEDHRGWFGSLMKPQTS